MTVPAILDHRGEPFRAFDSVTEAIEAAGGATNPFGRQQGVMARLFAPQLAYAAYLASGLMQKVIDIPAQDRVREWRDWQADTDEVTKLEAEEKRLCLLQKLKQAEVLRGIGGGAMILALPGLPSQPANPATVRERGLAAVNLISRWQLTLVDIDQNITSPTFGEPRMFRVTSGGSTVDIHPSRVIAFRGDPIPAGYSTTSDEAYWGQSRLVKVWREVERSDDTQGWFAALVKKAKLLRIGIPGLTDLTATDQGHQRLNRRIAAIALGESVLNATVYDAAVGSGADKTGEKIDDYQVSFTGIPAMMDAFDQRVAAVADIPFTRLMGRSPAGMNATGEHDSANWAAAVAAGQELELRPCLERLDPFLFASAGVDPADIWWKFAPLYKPTPKEETERFKSFTDGAKNLADVNAMPSAAFNAGVQSVIEANGWLPGASPILADMSEDERFGPTPDDDGTDPNELQAQQEGGDSTSQAATGGDGSAPVRRAANDAKPIPLYVQRKLLNADDLIAWAKKQGFTSTLAADDMHVTVLYSRTAVDPIKMGSTWSDDDKGNLSIKPGGPRAVEKLGDTAVVLLFASDDLSWRHRGMVEAGASHDYDEYQPHVTLTYEAGDVDLDKIKPFTGALRFGPELFEPLDLDWKQKVTEA